MDAAQPWTELAAVAMRRFPETLRRTRPRWPIVGTRPAITPAVLKVFDTSLGFLTAAGLQPDEAIALMNCLAAFTIRPLLADVSDPVGRQGRHRRISSRSVRRAVPPSARRLTGSYLYDPNDQFEQGLSALICGWSVRRS